MIIERRMTRNPVTATPDMSIADASSLMKQEKVHRLPVLDKDKKLVGLITEKDILYASPSPATSLSIHEMAYLLSKLTVK
jgi:acetoin utilization protein AcuB